MYSEPGESPALSPMVPQGYRITANCSQCGWPCVVPSGQYTGGTGYGVFGPNRFPVCYDCCSILERRAMAATGRTVLYLSRAGLTDWPGTLSFKIVRRAPFRHAFGPAEIAYFIGPDNKPWSAKRIGDMDLARAKRIKRFPFRHAANVRRLKTGSITLPSYWASALINGDYSGLEGDEDSRCAKAERKLALQGWSIVDVGESYFTNSYYIYDPDSGYSGGSVADYTLIERV